MEQEIIRILTMVEKGTLSEDEAKMKRLKSFNYWRRKIQRLKRSISKIRTQLLVLLKMTRNSDTLYRLKIKRRKWDELL